MNRRLMMSVSVVVAFLLLTSLPSAPARAFGPYETLYSAHLPVDSTVRHFLYTNDIQDHAFTFDAAAGEKLTIQANWIEGGDEDNDPWIWIVEGTPPVGIGEVFTFDFDAAITFPNVMRADNQITEWEVPRTGTWTLHANFYPYENGRYSLHMLRSAAAPPPQAEGWTGEFTQIEGGDRLTEGTIGGSTSWGVHSFPVDPGDMLTIMAWGMDLDQLVPRLALVEGGYDPASATPLASDAAEFGIAIINYLVPDTTPAGTLYTAVIEGGATTGDYSIWMRQWCAEDLLDQIGGGISGELAQTESGALRMRGTISNLSIYAVHSFAANPGNAVSITVTAARDTPAEILVPLVLLVPGGYVQGEQWLAMDMAEDTTAVLAPVTIPDFMPPNTIYTVVVADISNLDHLLFDLDPVFGYEGGYEVSVSID